MSPLGNSRSNPHRYRLLIKVNLLTEKRGGGLTPGKSPGNQDTWTNRGRSPGKYMN